MVDSRFVEINTSNANYFKAYQSSEGAGEGDFSTKRDLTLFILDTLFDLSGKNEMRSGNTDQKHTLFALVTQHFSDAVNQPAFPSTILESHEIFNSTTIYKFSTV